MQNKARVSDSKIVIKNTMKGDLIVSKDSDLIIYGALLGSIENHGKVEIYGSVQGDILNQDTGSIVVYGVVDRGKLINQQDASILIESSGIISNESVSNFGTITLLGEIISCCVNEVSGTIKNSGSLSTITNLGTIVNHGDLGGLNNLGIII